jgi:acyl-CoA synthetase (NDP forming)
LKLSTYDGVLFNHLYSSNFEAQMSRTFLTSVEKLVAKYQKPVCLAMISDRDEILDVSKNHAFPIFTSPLEAASALHVSLTYYERKRVRNARGKVPSYDVDRHTIQAVKELCPREKRIPFTNEALGICLAAGLQPVKSMVIENAKSVGRMPLKYPVALKLISRDASHKSDVGGVTINIMGRKALLTAIAEMEKTLKRLKPRPAIDGFLVQEMAPSGIECFVGGRRDQAFGSIIMVGLGGVFIEIFKDTSIRLAPVTKREADDMLKELKAYPLLKGVRGKGKADVKALVEVICRVSSLLTNCPEIAEMDLNPVIVHPDGQGISIVDARIFF